MGRLLAVSRHFRHVVCLRGFNEVFHGPAVCDIRKDSRQVSLSDDERLGVNLRFNINPFIDFKKLSQNRVENCSL